METLNLESIGVTPIRPSRGITSRVISPIISSSYVPWASKYVALLVYLNPNFPSSGVKVRMMHTIIIYDPKGPRTQIKGF